MYCIYIYIYNNYTYITKLDHYKKKVYDTMDDIKEKKPLLRKNQLIIYTINIYILTNLPIYGYYLLFTHIIYKLNMKR